MDDERPVIHCIVGYEWADDCRCASVVLTLDEAAELVPHGWTIMIDPFDWEVLTRWEQLRRAVRQRW